MNGPRGITTTGRRPVLAALRHARTLALGLVFLAPPLAPAEALSDSDRQLLLDKLKKLQETVEGRASGRIGVAVNAFRAAMTNNATAIALYLKCVEKIDFEDQHKKAQDFRDWKRKQGKRLEDPALGLALRHQLNWLVLTLEAADKPERIPELASRAAKAVEAIFADAAKLAGHQEVLHQAALGTIFARAYDVNTVPPGEWPEQPLAIGEIFDKVLLPPYRIPTKLTELREGWMRRIRYEGIMREGWAEQDSGNDSGNGTRISPKASVRAPAYQKFLADEVPNLMWRMEEDLFRAGDQRGAALRMLDHLEKHLAHHKAVDWAKSFVQLVNGPKPAATIPGGPPSTSGASPAPPPAP